jgi:hypothetical protein
MCHRLNLPHKDLEQQNSKLKCITAENYSDKTAFWMISTVNNIFLSDIHYFVRKNRLMI